MHALTLPAGETPTVVPPGGGRRVVVLARAGEELEALTPTLRTWRESKHTVVLMWVDGEPGERLRSFKARRPIRPASLPRSPRALLGGLRDGSLKQLVRERGTLAGDLRADPAALAELGRADAVLIVGEAAEGLAEDLRETLDETATPLVPDEEVTWWTELGRTWRILDRAVAELEGDGASEAPGAQRGRGVDLGAEAVAGLRARIDLLGVGVPAARQEALVAVLAGLARTGEHEASLDLVRHLTWEDGAQEQVHRRGLAALVRTTATGEEAPDLRASASALLQVADAALASVRQGLAGQDAGQDAGEDSGAQGPQGERSGDETRGGTGTGTGTGTGAGPEDESTEDALLRVVDATTLALELLFHRELHADGLSSPLVDDPDAFLADWRGSQVGQLLGSATPALPAVRDTRPSEGLPRVVLSPGTFPKFAGPVADALAEHAEVQELNLASRIDLRWLGVSSVIVERRLRHALGLPAGLDLELIEELEGADALFVDWADRAAVELVMSLPADRAATLRIHSMDALSAWVHLIDWSRVGDLVLVSEHLRAVVRGILGERLRHTRLHVVPNLVDLSRLSPDKTEGHRRRLLMTGWAQRVKDPLWALEILAALRADDPQWRLTLLGADFLLNQVASTQDYAREFWDRMVQDDLRDAVDIVGFTDAVGPVLAEAGFVLSTSRRESFGLGLVEGAISGCVPVVRDWPIYASVDGARGLFPQDWVVDSIEEAVARIRATCDEPAWTQASGAARAEAQERFAVDSAREQLQQIVLGVDS